MGNAISKVRCFWVSGACECLIITYSTCQAGIRLVYRARREVGRFCR